MNDQAKTDHEEVEITLTYRQLDMLNLCLCWGDVSTEGDLRNLAADIMRAREQFDTEWLASLRQEVRAVKTQRRLLLSLQALLKSVDREDRTLTELECMPGMPSYRGRHVDERISSC